MEAGNQRIALAKPFWYEVMWERHDDYEKVLTDVWKGRAVETVHDLHEKLREAANAFTTWGKSSFGAVRKELRELRAKLQQLRSHPMLGPRMRRLRWKSVWLNSAIGRR
jgi:hypothetical protein